MKVELNLLAVLLFVLAMSLYTKTNQEGKEEIPSHVELSQAHQNRVNEIISDREEFFSQVTEELRKAGFTYVTTGVVSGEGIQVNIILREDESVTEQMHEKVQKINEELLIKFNLAPEIFKVQVGHAETFK